MKTIIALSTIILFNVTLLLASGVKTGPVSSLNPVTPKEVTFEDADGLETLMMSESMLRLLAPTTPKEATFEDPDTLNTLIPDPSVLAPSTPKEADFSESGEASFVEII